LTCHVNVVVHHPYIEPLQGTSRFWQEKIVVDITKDQVQTAAPYHLASAADDVRHVVVHLTGDEDVVVFEDIGRKGSAGGAVPNPTYDAVCTGRTGHAEVIKVTFDPDVLSFRDLLTVFFTIHDPTTKDRQGNDVGTQYRSVIFCQTPEQRVDAEAVIANLTAQKLWRDPIATEVAQAATFYPAENYHQDYFARNGSQPYCQIVVAPKVAKFRKAFAERLKKKATA